MQAIALACACANPERSRATAAVSQGRRRRCSRRCWRPSTRRDNGSGVRARASCCRRSLRNRSRSRSRAAGGHRRRQRSPRHVPPHPTARDEMNTACLPKIRRRLLMITKAGGAPLLRSTSFTLNLPHSSVLVLDDDLLHLVERHLRPRAGQELAVVLRLEVRRHDHRRPLVPPVQKSATALGQPGPHKASARARLTSRPSARRCPTPSPPP